MQSSIRRLHKFIDMPKTIHIDTIKPRSAMQSSIRRLHQFINQFHVFLSFFTNEAVLP